MKKILFFSFLFCRLLSNAQTYEWALANPQGGNNPNFNYGGDGIKVDKEGNIYSFWFPENYNPETFNTGWWLNSYIKKYNNSGQEIWKAVIGRAQVFDIAISDDGDLYVTGQFWDTANFDNGTILTTSYYSGFFCRYDINGNLIWTKKAANSGRAVEVKNNKVYFAGVGGGVFDTIQLQKRLFVVESDIYGNFTWANGTDDYFDYLSSGLGVDAELNVYIIGTSNHMNYILSKFDSSGNLQWSLPFVGYRGLNITADSVGNCYVVGGYGIVYLAKYNTSGQLLWERIEDGFGTANKVVVDKNGNLYIVGTMKTGSIGNITVNGGGFFAAKYNSEGDVQWVKTSTISGDPYENSGFGTGTGIDTIGNIYASGMFYGTFHFDNLSTTGGGLGGYIPFLVKINDTFSTSVKEEKKTQGELAVYPNPSQNNFNLKIYLSEPDALQVNVTDVNGRVVYLERLPEFTGELNKQIELKQNSSGVYFLNVTGNKNNFSQKIILNH